LREAKFNTKSRKKVNSEKLAINAQLGSNIFWLSKLVAGRGGRALVQGAYPEGKNQKDESIPS